MYRFLCLSTFHQLLPPTLSSSHCCLSSSLFTALPSSLTPNLSFLAKCMKNDLVKSYLLFIFVWLSINLDFKYGMCLNRYINLIRMILYKIYLQDNNVLLPYNYAISIHKSLVCVIPVTTRSEIPNCFENELFTLFKVKMHFRRGAQL